MKRVGNVILTENDEEYKNLTEVLRIVDEVTQFFEWFFDGTIPENWEKALDNYRATLIHRVEETSS